MPLHSGMQGGDPQQCVSSLDCPKAPVQSIGRATGPAVQRLFQIAFCELLPYIAGWLEHLQQQWNA